MGSATQLGLSLCLPSAPPRRCLTSSSRPGGLPALCVAHVPAVAGALQDSAEFAKIGKYYATESMLVWDEQAQRYAADATPSYGSDTLEDFFTRAVQEGGLKGQDLGDASVFGVGRET